MGPNALVGSSTETREGVIAADDLLTLELSDDEVARAIGNRVDTSKKWWEKELKLDTARKTNEQYWMKQSLDKSSLYSYQTPYENNRIFINVESLIPRAISKPPKPVVTQAYDTDASEELAENLQKVLLALYEDLYLKEKFQMVARHLLIGYRVAYMKYRWDTTIGRIEKQDDGSLKPSGGLAVEVLRPQKVVIEQGSTNKRDIPLVGEYLSGTIDELCYKYPAKQDQIYKELGISKNEYVSGNRQVGYVETWFSYFNSKGEKQEAVAWKLNNIVLDKMKNPNWDYTPVKTDENGQEIFANFLDHPTKPYVVFNFLNVGEYVIDPTSLVEQASTLQDVLDKRGRQIVENADHANSGTIWNGQMVNEETVARMTGDPMEKVMADGDVTKAASRLPMNMLPPYVIQDKQDLRAQIDDVFGAHEPMKGDGSGQKTLGQDVLSTQNDLNRITTLATAVEDGADQLYKGLVQMMKIFWDSDDLVKYTGAEGKVDFITFSNNKIEDGIAVRVEAGSVLPDDKFAKAQEAAQLSPVLDPLTLAEDLNKHSPKEYAKRFFLIKADPQRYATDVLGLDPAGNVDQGAQQDIQGINDGQDVPPTENPTQEHLAQHQAFIQSPQFKQLPPQVQQAHLDHAKAEVAATKSALGNQVPSTPGAAPIPPGTNGQVQAAVAQQTGQPTPPGTSSNNPLARAARFLFNRK